MKNSVLLILLIVVNLFSSENSFKNLKPFPLNSLTSQESKVILDKGTERPYSGEYYNHKEDGTYTCKQCDAKLYKSNSKFDSGCGWPSFDDEIEGAIKRVPDADGKRVEILCNRCDAHLGHIFEGEGLTSKNIRHCVNSISLKFESKNTDTNKKAYFAGGCFWGVEYYFEKLAGVKSVDSGYMGGSLKNPTYRDVTRGKSGHLEVVEIVYNPEVVKYESLVKLFFEIHDSTQTNGQGPDIGSQYLSAIFTSDSDEKKVVKKLLKVLKSKGINASTSLLEHSEFYKAEEYHQDYYQKQNTLPYCHSYKKIF